MRTRSRLRFGARPRATTSASADANVNNSASIVAAPYIRFRGCASNSAITRIFIIARNHRTHTHTHTHQAAHEQTPIK